MVFESQPCWNSACLLSQCPCARPSVEGTGARLLLCEHLREDEGCSHVLEQSTFITDSFVYMFIWLYSHSPLTGLKNIRSTPKTFLWNTEANLVSPTEIPPWSAVRLRTTLKSLPSYHYFCAPEDQQLLTLQAWLVLQHSLSYFDRFKHSLVFTSVIICKCTHF